MVGAGSCSSLGRLAERFRNGGAAAEGHAAAGERGRGRLCALLPRHAGEADHHSAFLTEVTSTPRTRRTLCWPPAKCSRPRGGHIWGRQVRAGTARARGGGTLQSGSSQEVVGCRARGGPGVGTLVSRGYCACSGPCLAKRGATCPLPCLRPNSVPRQLPRIRTNSDRYVPGFMRGV